MFKVLRFNDASGWCNKSIKSFSLNTQWFIEKYIFSIFNWIKLFLQSNKKNNLKLFDANTVLIEAIIFIWLCF